MSRIMLGLTAFAALVLSFLTPTFAQTSAEQPPGKVLVTIVVTDDDSPALAARVTVKRMGAVEGWPEGKAELSMTTDLAGRAFVRLGPGKYMVTAHQSLDIKEPADGWFLIQRGEKRPRKIFLKLLYWDCAHVTCLL